MATVVYISLTFYVSSCVSFCSAAAKQSPCSHGSQKHEREGPLCVQQKEHEQRRKNAVAQTIGRARPKRNFWRARRLARRCIIPEVLHALRVWGKKNKKDGGGMEVYLLREELYVARL
ncbi:hypothetical protein MRX96_050277 [Rhipicephalus microplus]